MDKQQINIIVSCVSNKSVDVPSNLEFRNIKLDTIKNMGDKWVDKLLTTQVNTYEASQLYCGSAWKIVQETKQISEQLKNYEVNWYIMSVGYGFIRYTQKIKPYSITFSKPSFDGLRKRQLKQSANKEWWNYITTKRNLRIKDIATNDKTTIIVGSTEYINAVEDDLKQSKNIIIFSSTYNATKFVDRHVQTHEKMRFIVGGGKVDNNVRNLKYYVEHLDEWGVDLNEINNKFQEQINSIKQELPKVNRDREKITDEELNEIIMKIGLDKPMSNYIDEIRIKQNKKISEQKIISVIQELRKKDLPSKI
jgi:cytoplasmic iron level regulating protein YaaA (DUF328/UPF0246 family)